MSRRQGIPVEGSWRMVEPGENDSFDTSIVPADSQHHSSPSAHNDLDAFPSSGSAAGAPTTSQLSSGGLGSQDSIQDFFTKADDERVILRSPFRPTVPAAARQGAQSRRIGGGEAQRTPDPEFFMPSVDVEGSSRSSGRSSRTIRPAEERSAYDLRRRATAARGQRGDDDAYTRRRPGGRYGKDTPTEQHGGGVGGGVAESVSGAILGVLGWFFGVIGMAFRLAQRPLAFLLAIYFFFGGLIVVQNMVTKSIFVSLSPICRIPGVSYLDLSFCPRFPDPPTPSGGGGGPGESSRNVEFDELMGVQAQFEQVLERSADGVSLPLEMKRSEASIRDLRTMVRYSELPAREELVQEFDGYIETARRSTGDLQKFNTHVGSAVDSVISINRWTARYLDSLSDADQAAAGGAAPAGGPLGEWAAWAFAPFQPTTSDVFDERALVDKYIEHTSLVSDRIAQLILEAQSVLRHLTKAEDHLSLIYDIVTRSSKSVESRREQVLWTLWTLVGANSRRLGGLNAQLALLRQVDGQRSAAVAQVSALIVDLERIEAGLGDLRDRVAEPGIAREALEADEEARRDGRARVGGGARAVPLAVHIETIDRGVERLEAARNRIRAAEDDRIREALARGGVKEERLLEGQ